jgi:hypothetical protein
MKASIPAEMQRKAIFKEVGKLWHESGARAGLCDGGGRLV